MANFIGSYDETFFQNPIEGVGIYSSSNSSSGQSSPEKMQKEENCEKSDSNQQSQQDGVGEREKNGQDEMGKAANGMETEKGVDASKGEETMGKQAGNEKGSGGMLEEQTDGEKQAGAFAPNGTQHLKVDSHACLGKSGKQFQFNRPIILFDQNNNVVIDLDLEEKVEDLQISLSLQKREVEKFRTESLMEIGSKVWNELRAMERMKQKKEEQFEGIRAPVEIIRQKLICEETKLQEIVQTKQPTSAHLAQLVKQTEYVSETKAELETAYHTCRKELNDVQSKYEKDKMARWNCVLSTLIRMKEKFVEEDDRLKVQVLDPLKQELIEAKRQRALNISNRKRCYAGATGVDVPNKGKRLGLEDKNMFVQAQPRVNANGSQGGASMAQWIEHQVMNLDDGSITGGIGLTTDDDRYEEESNAAIHSGEEESNAGGD